MEMFFEQELRCPFLEIDIGRFFPGILDEGVQFPVEPFEIASLRSSLKPLGGLIFRDRVRLILLGAFRRFHHFQHRFFDLGVLYLVNPFHALFIPAERDEL